MKNRERTLAEEFVLHTNRSVFLTGKAGTGKTTLLRDIIRKSKKKTAVVAPTGIAAVNAGGVTIHSFFQLPPATFSPNADPVTLESITNRRVLAREQKLRPEKRQLIIELELLVIDEISMVRADLLDAIDYTLQRVRKNSSPFGGVQILVIGDLFQLAPIIKPPEWEVLRSYYNSPFFFDSIVWRQCNAIQIELKQVYRQADEVFIDILNRVRNGVGQAEDVAILNQRYTESPDSEDVITLTTHNRKADAINESELDNLLGKSVDLEARISGKFSASSYPTKEVITLKEGAQVMFVKNHPDGLYYNGKLGTIESIEDDYIRVHLIEDDRAIDVVEEQWKNTQYSVHPDTKEIRQEEIGTFEQYPFRLAWAITVHKSQGLTFDDVILDLENTFAPGQLYVALSRCRSLEGIKLSSNIRLQNIIVDHRVSAFYKTLVLHDQIDEILIRERKIYERDLLLTSFSLTKVMAYVENWRSFIIDEDIPAQREALKEVKKTSELLTILDATASKFGGQIVSLETDGASAIRSRYEKAIIYFTDEVHHQIIEKLEKHASLWKKQLGSKKYNYVVKDLVDECWRYMQRLYSLQLEGIDLHPDKPKHKQVILFDPDKKVKKRIVGETYAITHEMVKEGLSIAEIAEERKLSVGTIEGHMARLLKEDKIEISQLLSDARLEKIKNAIKDKVDLPSNEIMKGMGFDVSYGEIRWVREWLKKKN